MATSSSKIRINLPTSWNELSRSQLYYLYSLIADNLSYPQIKAYCFFKWGKILIVHRNEDSFFVKHGEIEGNLPVDDVAAAVSALDWIERFPNYPVRIERIDLFTAIDPCLRGLPFGKFIEADNYFQGYLHTQNEKLLVELGRILYGSKLLRINKCEKISIFYWFASAKSYLTKIFSDFFRPAGTPGNVLEDSDLSAQITDAMNAQIRALTKGDVTKEAEILKIELWRALTELNAQAKEYDEIKRKTNGKV